MDERRRTLGGFNDVTQNDIPPTPEDVVDLGLPSGTLWCTHNVGAEEPTEDGLYYQYGNVDGILGSEQNTNYSTYEITKGGRIYNLMFSVSGTDAAMDVCGEDYSIPTRAMWEELFACTTKTELTIDGVACFVLTSRINNNTLTIPKSGYFTSGSCSNKNTAFYGWSKDIEKITPSSYKNAYYGYITSSSYTVSTQNREYACTIRPVYTPQNLTTIFFVTTDGSDPSNIDVKITGEDNAIIQAYVNEEGKLYINESGVFTIESNSYQFNITTIECLGRKTYIVQATKNEIKYAYVTFDLTDYRNIKITVKDENDVTYEYDRETNMNTCPALRALRESSHLYMGYINGYKSAVVCQLDDDNGITFTDGTSVNIFSGDFGEYWMRIKVPFFIKRIEGGTSGDIIKYGIAVGGRPDRTWLQFITPDDMVGAGPASKTKYPSCGAQEVTDTTYRLYSVPTLSATAYGTSSYYYNNNYFSARKNYDGVIPMAFEWWNMLNFLFFAWYNTTYPIYELGGDKEATSITENHSIYRPENAKFSNYSKGFKDTSISEGTQGYTKFWGITSWVEQYTPIGNITLSNGVATITPINLESTRMINLSSISYTSKLMLSEYLDMVPSVGLSDALYDTTNMKPKGYGITSNVSTSYPRAYVTGKYISSIPDSATSIYTRLSFHGKVKEVSPQEYMKPQIVDFGLPSGTLWATKNLKSIAEAGTGYYYPYAGMTGSKLYENSTYSFGTLNKMSSNTTNDIPPKRETDVVRAILGDIWHIPTKTLFEELLRYSTIDTSSYLNQCNSGYKFTSIINGNSIFIPLAGYKSSYSTAGSLSGVTALTSTNNGSAGMILSNSSITTGSSSYCYPIRPVKDGTTKIITIVDENNDPVIGLDITLASSIWKYPYTTDENGQISVGMTSGEYTLEADLYDFSLQTVNLDDNTSFTITATWKQATEFGFIILDQSQTDSTKLILDENGHSEYDGLYETPEVIKSIRRDSHRYTATYINGVNYLRQLDDSDSTIYTDGFARPTTAETWVRFPIFYVRSTEVETDVWKIEFAYGGVPSGNKWIQWGGELVGAYKTTDNYSKPNQNPTTSTSLSSFRSGATNRGKGYNIKRWRHHCMMTVLFWAWYGKISSSTVLGNSTAGYSSSIKTGVSDILGMRDSTPSTIPTNGQNVFWGLEAWVSNQYEFVDGITYSYLSRVNIQSDIEGKPQRRFNYDDYSSVWSSNLYIGKFIIGNSLDLIIGEVAASSTASYLKYSSFGTSSNTSTYYVIDGYNTYDVPERWGIGSIRLDHTGSSDSSVGSRLTYNGRMVILNRAI